LRNLPHAEDQSARHAWNLYRSLDTDRPSRSTLPQLNRKRSRIPTPNGPRSSRFAVPKKATLSRPLLVLYEMQLLLAMRPHFLLPFSFVGTPFRTQRKIAVSILVFRLAASAATMSSGRDCNPELAPELLSVTVVNSASTRLKGYPVAISFDGSTFDFPEARRDGSDITAWNAASGRQLRHWMESYDPVARKALLWVRLPVLPPQGALRIWLTAGRIPRCSIHRGNGYSVFPFFSDAHDLGSWRGDSSLSLSDEVTEGPLLVGPPRVIESDGMYNSTPAVVEAANGDWVLSYRKGINHVNTPLVILRRSQDRGKTWSPEVAYFDTSGPDPTLARTPDGNLLLEFAQPAPQGKAGAAYSLSQDNGLTWGPFAFFDNPVSDTAAFPTAFLTVTGTMYGASYGPLADKLDAPFLWFSADNGATWTKRSQLRQLDEPGMDETAITRTGPGSLLAISRSDDGLDTYGRRSEDMGLTWGPLISYTSQVGVIQLPQLIRVGRALVLLGREALFVRVSSSYLAAPAQLVAFVSYDNGKTFTDGTVLDTYTGQSIDGGYCWPLKFEGNRLFVAYYGGSNPLVEKPDIKSLMLTLINPRPREVDALHLVTQLASAQATHALSFNQSRYSLDFRFRSRPSPAGSQFTVSLSGRDADGTADLVRWELPSTHSAYPPQYSGFIANRQFVQMLDSFEYGASYRIRTLVDETQGTQTPEVLDRFGQVLSFSAPQPFADGTTIHPSLLAIGNSSTLRSTDTLLDFIFLRPVADAEPEITISRVH
jgi:sialidase-1